MLQIFKYRKSGFGLLEAVVASGILVVLASVTVGTSTLIIQKTGSFDDKIVASNLAESGIETAHIVRDRMLNDNNPATSWSTGFTLDSNGVTLNCNTIPSNPTKGDGSSACGILPSDDQLISSNADQLSKIGFDNSADTIERNGINYTRKIYFQKDATDPDNIYEMRVVVYRNDGSSTDKPIADISAKLTNWKESI